MAAEPRTGRLDAITDHGADTRSLFLALDAPLVFRPGQFISCLLPIDGETIRPYSIASPPEQPTRLELLLNLVPGGAASAHLFGLEPGATLCFTGPWGTFVCDRAPAAEAVFIADGTGIAPIRPMLHRTLATGAGHPVRLLHATDHPLYADELDALAPRLDVARVPPSTLESEVRRRWIDADADRSRYFYICGVGPIVPALRDLLRRAGYERRAVQYEKW
jgi:ferredoxin-NADP reductase